MCGRYALYGPVSRLREAFLLAQCPDFEPRWNIAPQSRIPVIRQAPDGSRVGQLVRWGLIPPWADDPAVGARLNNARAETVAMKPSFRGAFARHRCLIPADGFYEWQTATGAGKRRKQPWYFHRAGGGFLAFAGLLAAWRPAGGDTVVSGCIITTAANATMAPIHERMPVIVDPSDFSAWLDPANQDTAALQELLVPCDPDLLAAHPVSPAINRGDVEGPGCIDPLAG